MKGGAGCRENIFDVACAYYAGGSSQTQLQRVASRLCPGARGGQVHFKSSVAALDAGHHAVSDLVAHCFCGG